MNQNRKQAPVSWKRGLVSLLVAMLVLNLCMPGIVTRAEELPAQEATAQIPEEGTVLPEGGAAEENLQPLTEEDSQEEITKEDTKEDTTEEEASEDATKEDTATEEESSEDTTKEEITTGEDTAVEDTEVVSEITSVNTIVTDAAVSGQQMETEVELSALEQMNAYYDQAVAAGPDAETSVYAEIYNGAMAVYTAAGSPSEADDPELYNAMGRIVMTLQGYGYDPYALATSADSGTFDHIEIEVAASATVTIDGVRYTEPLTITTSDTFTITAKQGDTVLVQGEDYQVSGNKTGDGSANGATVEITGKYPSGTKENPVYYTVSVTRNVTFYLRDADGNMLDANGNVTTDTSEAVVITTLPITLTVTVNYWMADNYCGGICRKQNGVYTWDANWQKGVFQSQAGIDYPIAGDAGNLIITKGKLMITKSIVNDDTDTTSFTFYVQNSEGKYVVFSNGEYSSLSDTLVDGCYVTVAAGSAITLTEFPEGGYKVTEVQGDGYIIANVNGTDTTTNYSTDFIQVTKEDESIPIATFKNKKLSDEAGISIAKTATGLNAYNNINVSIYSVGTDGNKTGSALWTGTLTPNGDRLYLPIQLEPGTYIIEESGHTVDGYNCTTTLSGGETVDGLKFTVAAGERYDLTVNNAYELPKLCNITISKTVTGNMGDWSKEFSFTATLSGTGYSFAGVTYSINGGAAQSAGTGTTCAFSLKHGDSVTFTGLPIGATFKVEETDAEGYDTTVDKVSGTSKTIPLAETNAPIAFVNDKNAVIETGLRFDSFPMYLLMSTMIVFGGLLLIRKRRYGDWM